MKRYCEICGVKIEHGRFCRDCYWQIEERAMILAREWLKRKTA